MIKEKDLEEIYAYQVLFYRYNMHEFEWDDALKWCNEIVGVGYWNYWETYSRSTFYFRYEKDAASIFYFKYEKDAAMFKLKYA